MESGDLRLLIIEGEPTEKEAIEAWDKIIVKNNELNGGYDFINYVDTLQGYSITLAEYNLIKAMLLKLVALNIEARINIEHDDLFIQDEYLISELKKRKYKIDTSSASNFWKTLAEALQKSESIQTRLKIKIHELEEFTKGEGTGTTFDELLANVSAALGFVIPDDITLARFNEYRKILKRQQPKAA